MAKNKKLLWQLPFLVLLIVGSVIIVRQQKNTPYQHDLCLAPNIISPINVPKI